jgi:transposase
MNVVAHHTIDELYTAYRTETSARLARRIQTLCLARKGKTCPEIMEITGASRRAIQQWVEKYNRGGLEELTDRPRSGRPLRLSDTQLRQLEQWVEQGPCPQDIVSVYSASAIDARLEREFGVLYSLRGLQHLLGRLGFSYQCPRPKHENSDPDAQEEFKKNSRPCWIKCNETIPTSGS